VTRRTSSRLLLAALATALAATITGCGGATDPKADPSASASTPTFDPCAGLAAAPVAKALGAGLKVDRGTTGSARCALLPAKKGGPTYELNYLWFDGGLDAAFATMTIPAGTVTKPKVAGADAARLIVQKTSKAYYISGFVQNGNLIQSLNGIALKPYAAAKMHRAALVLLAEMSANAPS